MLRSRLGRWLPDEWLSLRMPFVKDQRLATPSGTRYSEGAMPPEAHLDAGWDTAGVRPNPRLVRMEDDPDLTCSVAGLVTGRLAIIEVPPVAGNE